MKSEKTFENKVKLYLKQKGAYFIKTHGDRFSKVGVPDLIVCYKGLFIGIELKAPNGKPSELQLAHLKMIHKAGGMSMLLRPSTVDALWLELDMIDEREVTTRTHEN